jgi:4'-phosphopantetheinyl transferase EntD
MAIGIDAEPHEALPDSLMERICVPRERVSVRQLPGGFHWDRLVFCAKESVYKAWFARMESWLDF